jgi:hypothetical protein
MTESPAYSVEKKEGNFEIRKYEDYVLAQVDVNADYKRAMSMGFSILAGYIFGGNTKKTKIPMTTPVTGINIHKSENIPMTVPVTEEKIKETQKAEAEKIPMTVPVTEENRGEEIYRISFTMPSKYTIETLPEPDDKRIKFKEEKNQQMVVLRFSGRAKEDLSQDKIEELKQWLSDNSLEPKSNFIVAQYNHPAIPGFLRRNEIIVKI